MHMQVHLHVVTCAWFSPNGTLCFHSQDAISVVVADSVKGTTSSTACCVFDERFFEHALWLRVEPLLESETMLLGATYDDFTKVVIMVIMLVDLCASSENLFSCPQCDACFFQQYLDHTRDGPVPTELQGRNISDEKRQARKKWEEDNPIGGKEAAALCYRNQHGKVSFSAVS